MLNKIFFTKIKRILLDYTEKRREVIKLSGDILHLAKQAIFALQRDETKNADRLLDKAEKNIRQLNKKFQKDGRLLSEGSYRAALEEYVEGFLFRRCLNNKSLGRISDLNVDTVVFVAGLADVPGELARYAIKSATERKFEVAKRCYEQAEEIIGAMTAMNLTGYNRQKFDQAKQSLRKLEQIVYEVSMKN